MCARNPIEFSRDAFLTASKYFIEGWLPFDGGEISSGWNREKWNDRLTRTRNLWPLAQMRSRWRTWKHTSPLLQIILRRSFSSAHVCADSRKKILDSRVRVRLLNIICLISSRYWISFTRRSAIIEANFNFVSIDYCCINYIFYKPWRLDLSHRYIPYSRFIGFLIRVKKNRRADRSSCYYHLLSKLRSILKAISNGELNEHNLYSEHFHSVY